VERVGNKQVSSSSCLSCVLRSEEATTIAEKSAVQTISLGSCSEGFGVRWGDDKVVT
jgi:hypothetical protein